ncbi:MAG: VWA domain-containing protein [Oligoflexia bacterium]|nr:VWA domain-containing protein [Oligoflexia bacterium]
MKLEGFSSIVPLLAMLIVVALALAFSFVPRFRKCLALAGPVFYLRAFALMLLALACARPYTESRRESGSALLLMDISDSMEAPIAQLLLDRARQLESSNVPLDVMPFSAKAASAPVRLKSGQTFRQLQDSWNKLDIGATNLESGIEAALQQPPQSVILISDGRETRGDARRLVGALRSLGSRVYPLVPDDISAQHTDAFKVAKLYAPLVAPAQKSVEIRTTLKNAAETSLSGTLEIVHAGKVIASRAVTVPAGQEIVEVAESDPSAEGVQEITATLKPDNSAYPPSAESIFLSSQPREKVLLLSGNAEDSKFLKEGLENQSYQLKSFVGDLRAEKLPALEDFSSLVLNNISADQLPAAMLPAIEAYVRNGGGLVMLGGNRSFGLGNYKDTEVAKAIPVEMLPPETVKKRLNLAMSLVLDKSRSMADGEKLDYAKEAARETIRNLKSDDLVQVVGFDASPFVVVEMSQVGENRERAIDRVSRLFPAGQTNLLPAIDEARRSLVRANAGRKHMIILTDGKIPDEGPYYVELVKQLRLLGITVSTVLLGSGTDPGMLRTMADQGGGAFYQTNDPRSLPKIFLMDVKIGSGEQTLKEDLEYLVRQGTGEIVTTEIRTFPPVRGYVQTRPREGANLELVAFGLDRAEPLLASWGYGKGKSVAFTSDASGRWSNYWVAWPRFATFWSEVVDWVRKKDAIDANVRFDLRTTVAKSNLNLDLSIFSDKTPGSVRALLRLPSGEERSVGFTSISAGHYQSVVPGIMAGRYDLSVIADGVKLAPVAFSLPGSLFGERKGEGFDGALLSYLADASGGRINPQPADLRAQTYVQLERHDLTPWFVLVALLLILVEIVLRELQINLFSNPRLWRCA